MGEQIVNVTGFAPRVWDWAGGVSLDVQQSGVYTVSVWMREDGLRVDRLLLTTDTTYLPVGYGPVESIRQTDDFSDTLTTLARTITYNYDDLYHLISADYTSDELYQYTYDPVGNRLQQIINGDTTTYLYDAANRLTNVNGVGYTFDDNDNLLHTGVMTNTWDAANRLIASQRNGTLLQPMYDGVGNRIGQVNNGVTTTFALDVATGLPEVIYTGNSNTYLHLPGVIATENAVGERRYLLSDGLGSVRQAVDETAKVVSYSEFDPYGTSVQNGDEVYGFTGEWWEDEIDLLYLRARWYFPEDGVFLSRDAIEGEPPYSYVRGNPVNLVDPSGLFPRELIEASLRGRRIEDAFRERAGLYHLLLDANKYVNIWPSAVDFGEPDVSNGGTSPRYPLRPSQPVVGTIWCDQSELIFSPFTGSAVDDMDHPSFGPSIKYHMFTIQGIPKVPLSQYLVMLEVAAQQERARSTTWWRPKTLELHYYRTRKGNSSAKYYDDFGQTTQLPDAISIAGGAEFFLGLEVGVIADRFGQTYVQIAGGFGLSLSVGYYMEGYAARGGVIRPRGRVNSPAELANSITGLGVVVMGPGAFDREGFGDTEYEDVVFAWYSTGADMGILSVSFGYVWQSTTDERLTWDWVDKESVGYDATSLGFDSGATVDECNICEFFFP